MVVEMCPLTEIDGRLQSLYDLDDCAVCTRLKTAETTAIVAENELFVSIS